MSSDGSGTMVAPGPAGAALAMRRGALTAGRPSRGEEVANSVTHALGAVLAVAGLVVLALSAIRYGTARSIVGCLVFGSALVFLYSVSTLYHSVGSGRSCAKAVLRVLDHSAIFLLIASTYTPFTLVSLRGPWGWSLFGVVWGLAVVGIVQELWLGKKTRVLSLPIYILMGWIALIAIVPLVQALGWRGFAWVAAGGVTYTAGIVFYLFDEKFTHWHGIWHLFVVAGSAIHYFAILQYVA